MTFEVGQVPHPGRRLGRVRYNRSHMPRSAEPALVKDGPVPLYQQLHVILRERVRSGRLVPGDLIPPESALMRDFGVSRITVRAALEQLVREGLIERQRGRGSFVRAAAPDDDPRACLVSFTAQVLAAGRVPGTRDVSVERGDAARVGLPPATFDAQEPIVRIERLRTVDGVPAALLRSFLPERLVPGVEAGHFPANGPRQSLLFVLERAFGLRLDHGEETTFAAPIDPATAAALAVAAGSAVVVKTCLMREAAGKPVLYEVSYWRPQTQQLRRVVSGS
jgi:GntR family transcriptional regulator